MVSSYLMGAILVSALVTWVPRILPYFLVKIAELPEKVVKFLSFLPITIIFALILSSLFPARSGQLPSVQWIELVAVVPTFVVMAKSKNVMLAVVVGICCVAGLRYFF